MTLFSTAVFLSLLATVTSEPAPGLAVSDITVNHGKVVQTKNLGDDAVAYFAIHNDGAAPDMLTKWSCNNATTTDLVDASGKPLKNLTIPPRQSVTLTANGVHLILRGNHYRVIHGSILPCAMTFQNEGAVQLLLYAIDEKT
jgi:copper(I)-binding protein